MVGAQQSLIFAVRRHSFVGWAQHPSPSRGRGVRLCRFLVCLACRGVAARAGWGSAERQALAEATSAPAIPGPTWQATAADTIGVPATPPGASAGHTAGAPVESVTVTVAFQSPSATGVIGADFADWSDAPTVATAALSEPAVTVTGAPEASSGAAASVSPRSSSHAQLIVPAASSIEMSTAVMGSGPLLTVTPRRVAKGCVGVNDATTAASAAMVCCWATTAADRSATARRASSSAFSKSRSSGSGRASLISRSRYPWSAAHTATASFADPAPRTLVDTVSERIIEAFLPNWTGGADRAGGAYLVAGLGEENDRIHLATGCLGAPPRPVAHWCNSRRSNTPSRSGSLVMISLAYREVRLLFSLNGLVSSVVDSMDLHLATSKSIFMPNLR